MPVYAFNAVIKRVKIRSRQLFGACFIGAARLSYLTSATKRPCPENWGKVFAL